MIGFLVYYISDSFKYFYEKIIFMKKKHKAAVIFDWDMTLAHVMKDRPISVKLGALFQSNGLYFSTEEIEQAVITRQILIQNGKLKGKIDLQNRREIACFYKQLLSILGMGKTDIHFAYDLYKGYANLPTFLYEESRTTLLTLFNQGFPLGIITNNSSSARKVIENNIGDLIPSKSILISEEIGVHKPSKTIFLKMAARFNTHPHNCIFVGDNLNVDARASVNIGGYKCGIWIDRNNTGKELKLPDNIFRIQSLIEVVPITKQFLLN
jgi:FMN phosphatase YigB (HAD superfamily)